MQPPLDAVFEYRTRHISQLAERAIFEAKKAYNGNEKLVFAGQMAIVHEAVTAILGTNEQFAAYVACLDQAGTPCEHRSAPASTLTPGNIRQFPATQRG